MNKLSFFIVLILTLALPGVSFAAEGHGPDPFGIINFFILITLLFLVLKKPIPQFFRGRALKTKLAIDEAQKAYDDAFRHYEEIQCKLKNADVEGKELLASIKEEAELEKQKIVVQARELAENIKKDAKRLADHEIKRARVALKEEAISIAAELAAEKIKTRLSADDHQQIGKEFVGQIQKESA
ncbi:MAG: ATP synthase F0 subunit B [Deltaproteobacteria bacterium]|nr:ATP synthase F0 subunit B [Deltaproteobacteria bacterium]